MKLLDVEQGLWSPTLLHNQGADKTPGAVDSTCFYRMLKVDAHTVSFLLVGEIAIALLEICLIEERDDLLTAQ